MVSGRSPPPICWQKSAGICKVIEVCPVDLCRQLYGEAKAPVALGSHIHLHCQHWDDMELVENQLSLPLTLFIGAIY